MLALIDGLACLFNQPITQRYEVIDHGLVESGCFHKFIQMYDICDSSEKLILRIEQNCYPANQQLSHFDFDKRKQIFLFDYISGYSLNLSRLYILVLKNVVSEIVIDLCYFDTVLELEGDIILRGYLRRACEDRICFRLFLFIERMVYENLALTSSQLELLTLHFQRRFSVVDASTLHVAINLRIGYSSTAFQSILIADLCSFVVL